MMELFVGMSMEGGVLEAQLEEDYLVDLLHPVAS